MRPHRLLQRNRVNVLQIHEADWHRWWSDDAIDDRFLRDGIDYDFIDAPVMRVLAEAKEQGAAMPSASPETRPGVQLWLCSTKRWTPISSP